MADHTHIEWTDATWNPITGCAVVSPGCTNCYAMKLAGTRLKHHPSRAGLTRDSKAGPVWTGEVRLNEHWLDQPLRWQRPRKIFVCAHGDLFAEAVPDDWIDRVFAVMALSPQHTFQVLTKRADRMRAYLSGSHRFNAILDAGIEMAPWQWKTVSNGVESRPHPQLPFPNVWLGVSAEDQARADQRIPDLLATPAAIRFLSAEPLLGPLELWKYLRQLCSRCPPWESPCRIGCEHCIRLDWVIVGGESGPGARPMHPAWPRQLRDQCHAAGVPYFFKQWGDWAHSEQIPAPVPGPTFFDNEGKPSGDGWRFWTDGDRGMDASIRVGKKAASRLLDGVEHGAFPEAHP